MDRWKGKIAVVTGASVGIGAAIVEQLLNKGLHVVGLARKNEEFLKLSEKMKGKPGKFDFAVVDLTKEEKVTETFSWITTTLGPIHILINNAGCFAMTNLTEGKAELWRQVFDTNVIALCVTTREAVKDMRKNNVAGHIIHINSMAGHSITCWPMNVYSASKYSVTALTETLRLELNSIGSKIKISSISPGYTSTGIISASSEFSGVPKNDFWVNWEQNAPALKPEDVANAVDYVLSTPPHVQVHELKIQAIA